MTSATNNRNNLPRQLACLAAVLLMTGTPHGLLHAQTAIKSPKTDTTPPPRSVVRFFNGDSLQGDLLVIKPDGVIRWQHTVIASPVEFDAKEVAIIQLQLPSTGSTSNVVPNAEITLTNGDNFRGKLLTLTHDTLTVDTSYAGTLAVPRRMISEINPTIAGGAAWYLGPNSADEWTPVNETIGWSFDQGELVNMRRALITRDIKTDDLSQIELELKWSDYNHLRVMLYRDSCGTQKQQPNNQFSMIDIGGNRVTIQCAADGVVAFTDSAQFNQNLLTDRQVAVRILIDRPKKTIHLIIDDMLVKTWQIEGKTMPAGGCIGLASNSVGTRIGNIRIGPWNGNLPKPKRKTLSEQDTVHFVNEDTMTGSIESIADNQVTIATANAPLTVPMNRIASIRFSDTKREIPRRRPGDVRCTFVQGGKLTFQIQSVQDGRIACTSENFSAATINLNVFSHIQFNIYSDRHNTLSSSAKSPTSPNRMFIDWME